MNSEEIRNTYSMQDIVEKYGFQLNRSDMICCPFHNDKHPSMKIYRKNFHCFTCGKHGDIFDFIGVYENISFKEAFAMLGGTKESDPNFLEDKKKQRLLKQQKERTQKRIRWLEEKEADILKKILPTIPKNSSSYEWVMFELTRIYWNLVRYARWDEYETSEETQEGFKRWLMLVD